MKFLIASLKTLTSYKNCSVSRIQFLFRFSFTLIGQFSGSQAGYGTTFRDKGGYQKAGKSSLKRVTGMKFTISKWFRRSKQKLWFGFPTQKTTRKYENLQRSFKKILFRLLVPKIFISWHYPFKGIFQKNHRMSHLIRWQREKKYLERES